VRRANGNGGVVSAYTVADLQLGEEPVEIPVQLCWRESDPYAVRMLFLRGPDESEDVPWLISRDLLAEGLYTPSGIGDIHIAPDGCCEDCDEEFTVIELDTPDGAAVFGFVTEELAAFLQDTYDQCPPGAESLVIDLDVEIEWLLRSNW
jgi:hypothetical protein